MRALDAQPFVQELLGDPASSHWLKALLVSASNRDPVDVLNDLEAARMAVPDHLDLIVLEASL